MSLSGDYLLIKDSDFCCPLHINAELEIVWVKKGPFCIRYEERELVLNDNQAMVIMPYRVHGFSCGKDVDANVLMFSSSIAQEFYNKYRSIDMQKDVFAVSSVLADFICEELSYVKTNKSTFTVKSIFFSLLSEYLKNNEVVENTKPIVYEARKLFDYISDKIGEDLIIDDVVDGLKMSKQKICNMFKDYLGIGFNEFISIIRVEKAQNMIMSSDLSITEIAYECGFGSVRNFNRVFLKLLKCTPSELRKNGFVRINTEN